MIVWLARVWTTDRLVAVWRGGVAAVVVAPPLFLRSRPVSVGRVGEVFVFVFRVGYSGLT